MILVILWRRSDTCIRHITSCACPITSYQTTLVMARGKQAALSQNGHPLYDSAHADIPFLLSCLFMFMVLILLIILTLLQGPDYFQLYDQSTTGWSSFQSAIDAALINAFNSEEWPGYIVVCVFCLFDSTLFPTSCYREPSP